MELSFSSEREEYEDIELPPTMPAPIRPPVVAAAAPLPALRPRGHIGWGGSQGSGEFVGGAAAIGGLSLPPVSSSSSSSSPLVKPLPFILSPLQPPTSAKLAAGVGVGSSSVTEEAVQAFEATDLESSPRRRRHSSRSKQSNSASQNKRKKKNNQTGLSSGTVEDFAPGAIGLIEDDNDDNGAKHSGRAGHSNKDPALGGLQVLDGGIVVGSGAQRSMISDMARKGGRGAFAPDKELQFSSDEEEEDEQGRPPRRKPAAKNKTKEDKLPVDSSDVDASGGFRAASAARSEPLDVAPLINEVALDFVMRRWITTILGGMAVCWSARPTDERQPGVPASFIGVQTILLLYPAIVCLIFNALRYYELLTPPGIMALIAGCIGAVMHVLIYTIHRSLVGIGGGSGARPISRRSSTRVADSSQGGETAAGAQQPISQDNFEKQLQFIVKAQAIRDGTLSKPAADEEQGGKKQKKKVSMHDADADDDLIAEEAKNAPPLRLFSPLVCAFILSPTVRPLGRMLIHALVTGTLMAGACYFLDWHFIAMQYHASASDLLSASLSAPSIVYLVFAWLSFCMCIYGLNTGRPFAEPNKYSAHEGVEGLINAPFMRMLYAGGIIALNVVLRLQAELDAPQAVSEKAVDVHDVALIFFPILPALFAVGLLPPLDALFHWAVEQINTVLYGTTLAANSLRSVAFLLMHTVAAVVVFLLWLYTSRSTAMLFAIGLSFLLGWNILPMRVGATVPVAPDDPDTPFPSSLVHSRSLLPLRLSSLFKLVVCLIAIIIGLVLYPGLNVNLISELQVLHEADLAFDLIALVLGVILFIMSELYAPFIIGAQFKNPFYKKLVLERSKPKQDNESSPSPLSAHEIFLWGVRGFLVLYISFHLSPNLFPSGSHVYSSHNGRAELFAYSVVLLRCYTMAWTQPFNAVIHLLWVLVLNLATDSMSSTYWSDLDWSVRFLICGFVWFRFRHDYLPKFWFMTVLTYTSFTSPKLRMRHETLMRTLCILLLPYHLTILAVSSFLGCQILPLCGASIFMLAYPRPHRIWEQYGGRYGMNEAGPHANGGPDTLFYQQMYPSIYQTLQTQLRSGPLSYSLTAGDFFLLRCEPYLIWASVLESGLGYVVVQLKGLELQTTSCHTVEALRIDESIEQVMNAANGSGSSLNPLGFTFSYTPTLHLDGVRSYSITKNVLTGIIDDLENLNLIRVAFMRTIMFLMKEELTQRATGAGGELKMERLPKHWLKPTVSNYDLQQLEERSVWPTAYYNYLFSSTPLSPSDASLFKQVVLSCYALVETLSSDMVSSGGKATPAHVLSTFQGVVRPSLYSDYLLSLDQPDAITLKSLVIRSYRYAVKSLYDCASLACLEVLSSLEDVEQFEEFHALIKEYQEEWCIGVVEHNPEWEKNLVSGEKKLFTIDRAADEANKYTSLTLEMSRLRLTLCRLHGATIRSIWCSLALELYYFANDDDERYSIQAHTQLLRNLSVQTSEPPFGYPVYSGLPTALSTN